MVVGEGVGTPTPHCLSTLEVEDQDEAAGVARDLTAASQGNTTAVVTAITHVRLKMGIEEVEAEVEMVQGEVVVGACGLR